MNSENIRPIVKQISEVERHISECEQIIVEIQKQYNIPADWFSEQFNADNHQFKSDVEKSAYEEISRYQSEIVVYLKKIGLTREALKSISNQINTGDVDDVEAITKMAILEENLELVVNIAKKYRHQAPAMEFLDLVVAGNSGLLSALDNYDYKRGFQFRTYAEWWIRQDVSRAIADYNVIS